MQRELRARRHQAQILKQRLSFKAEPKAPKPTQALKDAIHEFNLALVWCHAMRCHQPFRTADLALAMGADAGWVVEHLKELRARGCIHHGGKGVASRWAVIYSARLSHPQG